MSDSIGFIGAGSMAEALIRGIVAADVAQPQDIVVTDVDSERRELLASLGVSAAVTNRELPERCGVIVVAVKPQQAEEVLGDIDETLLSSHLLISIMAGVTTETIEARVAQGVPVVRAMPNILCFVREAATALSLGTHATQAHLERAKEIFSAVGRVVTVDEALMDAVTGLSGSGPAYVFTMIEALTDGGVAEGLPRDVARTLAAQTVLGSAKMILESEVHPAVWRDRVTSPAGTTAEGLALLEEGGVRSALIRAVRGAARRSKALREG